MDFDPWRWVAVPAWGLVLLALPPLAFLLAGSNLGLGAAFLAGFIALLTVRFLFSNRVLDSWFLAAAMSGRHIVEPVPVCLLRVRSRENREVQVFLKGDLQGASVIEGDRIRVRGTWRRGVLHGRRVDCDRTGAETSIRRPTALYAALAGLVILALATLWTFQTGLPWAGEQYKQFRDDFPGRARAIPTYTNYP